MNPEALRALLDAVAAGTVSPSEARERLMALPYEDLGFARLDHHRWARRGFPEAVYGEGKTAEEVVRILIAFRERGAPCLVTRLDGEKAEVARQAFPEFVWHPRARLGYLGAEPGAGEGNVLVLSAGTSDAPVAEEAAHTARYLGAKVELRSDVGIAGLHRLAGVLPELRGANVVVAVAGMEGALPAVVAGLTPALVIGVPTSVGFGVHEGGRTPLFAMLSSCVPGLLVVNVDGGFSAGYAAAAVNRAIARGGPGP